ncbi:MAG: S26 family signal peptidase [Litorimonas sp.]
MFKFVKVRGESMTPTLAPGDYLLVTKARAVRAGFVVLVDHPKYGVIVKRIASVSGDSINLEGDGPESTSTEALGHVALKNIKGRARLAITPKGLKRL